MNQANTRRNAFKGKSRFEFLRSLVVPRITKVNSWAAVLFAVLVTVYSAHRIASYKMNTREWAKSPLNDVPRKCPSPSYKTVISDSQESLSSPIKICMTTLTDAKKADSLQRLVRWRNFDSLLEMTWPNKEKYCRKHNYYLFDESDSLDTTRPPSWSKIRAAQRLLREEKCDWVLWLDADTVIMNSDKRIESFLPEKGDLVLTRQKGGSYNAGAWAIKNTPWALSFLDTWWGMTSYVQPKGLSTSGDNAALKAYLTQNMDPKEFQDHIVVPPRCQFNSDATFISPKEAADYERNPEKVKDYPGYMSDSKYHLGDLVAHVAGKNNKIDTTQILLKEAK